MTDYISTLSIDLSLIGPELTLLTTASLILLLVFTRRADRFAPVFAFAGLAVAFILSVLQWDVKAGGFSGMVAVDQFSVTFKLLFIVASMFTLLMAYRYFAVKQISRPEFYALLLISAMGMMVMASTTDLILMFLGLEIMSVPLYVMAGFNRRSLESNEAGIKYFIMGAFSTGFLLMGIAFIFGASGTTDLRWIITDFNHIISNVPLYLFAGAAFLLIGFGFKVGAVPFHTWVPDVYQGAPTPVTAFFSVAPKAAGFAVLLKVFSYGLRDLSVISSVFWVVAVLTMSVGNILALRQDNLKRMLAYSSISHAGYVLVALAVGGASATSAAIFYLVAYTLFNLGAFAVVILLEMRSGSHADLKELTGLSTVHPYLAATLALFMFALSGFPPTVGFFGKFYLFSAAVKSGFIWLAVIGVMNSFVSVYYYLRVIKVSYFDQMEERFIPAPKSIAILIVLIVTAIGTIGLGFFPERLLEISQAAVFSLF